MATESQRRRPNGQRYAVWMGALVTGFGTHGAACWVTQIGRDYMRITVAKPAVLSARRLKPGRTLIVHLSHRTGETWRILPIRAAVIRADGNTFSVRVLAPGPEVIEGLLRALLVQSRAKELFGRLDETAPPMSSSSPSTAPAQARSERASDAEEIAQACREVIENYGAKWVASFLDRTEELLFAYISQEKESLLQRQLNECYLSLLMAREKLETEIPRQLTATVVEFLTSEEARHGEAQGRGNAHNLDLMGTVNLEDVLAFNEAVDFLDRTAAPGTVLSLEQRMSDLLGKTVDERNNPLRVDRICALAMGVLFENWYSGASVRQIVNDALRDSGASLGELYDALSAVFEQDL